MQNLSKIEQETKKLQKMGNDIISKHSSAIFCVYFLLILIDVPSLKSIEGQTKELQGVVPNTPRAENDQKSPGRIGRRFAIFFLLWLPSLVQSFFYFISFSNTANVSYLLDEVTHYKGNFIKVKEAFLHLDRKGQKVWLIHIKRIEEIFSKYSINHIVA